MKYTIINIQDIPKDIPPGIYRAVIVDTVLTGPELEIKLRYDGPMTDENSTLLKIVKEEDKPPEADY